MRYTRVVWSISQLPFLGPSLQQTLLDFILNFFMNSLSQISSYFCPVTPMMFLPNSPRQALSCFGESLSGSTDTKTSFSLRQAPSGRFLMIRYTDERQQRVLGQMSGQLVQPKYMRQQYPARLRLENGCPSEFVNVQSPPISDSLGLSYFRPEMSSSMMSRFQSLFLLAEQQRQASPAVSATIPAIPPFVTLLYVFSYESSLKGSVFIAFCYCIIHASCLFRGILSSEKPICS